MRTLSIECGSRASIYTRGRCRQQEKGGGGVRNRGGNWNRVVRQPGFGRYEHWMCRLL